MVGSTGCWLVVVECLTLSAAYVCSLYVWSSPLNRDHPSTIRRRLVSVSVMGIVSPVFSYYCVSDEPLASRSFWELIGIRSAGLFAASTVPLLLTAFLFLGPLVVKTLGELSSGEELSRWAANVVSCRWLTDIYWLRDHLVAPLTEELTFRASLVPLLAQCLSPAMVVLVSPAFFGVAHLHHVVGLVKSGVPLKRAALIAVFQLSYTTLFGLYSAFLFLRTGHLVAPFLAHAFCNFMGFPGFADVIAYDEPRRTLTFALFVGGFVSWCWLLFPLTDPLLYDNHIYWESCPS